MLRGGLFCETPPPVKQNFGIHVSIEIRDQRSVEEFRERNPHVELRLISGQFAMSKLSSLVFFDCLVFGICSSNNDLQEVIYGVLYRLATYSIRKLV